MHDPNYFYELQVDNFLEVQKELNSIIDQIDFPDQNILRFYRPTDDVNPFKENKLLREFTKKLNMPENLNYMVNYVKSNGQMNVHVDDSDWPWCVLIPIRNTKGTRLEFYKSEKAGQRKTTVNAKGEEFSYVQIPMYDNQLSLLHELELLNPIVFNNQQPHNVTNFTNKNRYTMQINCSEIEWNHMLAEEFFIL